MANVDQIAYWNAEGGARWLAFAERTAVKFAPLSDALIEVAKPTSGENVLDIGCGAGPTLIKLARRVAPGLVVGLDVSAMLANAAVKAIADAGVTNARVVVGDAASYGFPQPAFDLLFSQFGVMFFSDPVAAFTNLRTALKPNGRLAFACWREMSANPLMTVPLAAIQGIAPAPEPVSPGAPGPFAFFDPKRVENILRDAGFRDIAIAPHDATLRLGTSQELTIAAEHAANTGPSGRILAKVDAETKSAAIDAIRSMLEQHVHDGYIELDAAIWLVTGVGP